MTDTCCSGGPPAFGGCKAEKALVAQMGTITVKVFRILEVAEEEASNLEYNGLDDVQETPKVSEKLLKGKTISHSVMSGLSCG